jgi:hypothetical protein
LIYEQFNKVNGDGIVNALDLGARAESNRNQPVGGTAHGRVVQPAMHPEFGRGFPVRWRKCRHSAH